MFKPQNDPRAAHLSTRRSIRRHCLMTGAASAALVLGFGTLGATTRLAGAVIAEGTIVVKTSVKKVSHPTGGTVASLRIQDGDRVAAGDVLLRLDATAAQATYDALTRNLHEMAAQSARLEAERDGSDAVAFPAELAEAGSTDKGIVHVTDGETTLFRLRRDARTGQKNQLHQRVAELQHEINGLVEQRTAKEGELAIAEKELVGVQDLFARNLVQLTRLDGLARDVARTKGERGALTASIAQTEGKIAETELQIIQVDEDMRSDVAKQLADIRARTSDVVQRRIAAFDQLKHLDIRAPQGGIVHELAVHAAGAVVTPGETILLVVPDGDRLVAEVHVAPQDIDKVAAEQSSVLRFPSFDQRTTPEVDARVALVSASTSEDQRGGAPYYTVQFALQPRDGSAEPALRPGMPVDAFIKTADRTMWSYLVKPLADQMGRAFREK